MYQLVRRADITQSMPEGIMAIDPMWPASEKTGNGRQSNGSVTQRGPAQVQDARQERFLDYYEFLQISPRAEFGTIQRVYRFLASRYHPDNPETGDAEKFLILKHVYETLSDPVRRQEYDSSRTQVQDVPPDPVFESVDFLDGIEGELNRRLAVLSLLYSKRRTTPDEPRVSLADLERRMGFPREYLDFATWYLRSKKFITKEDNSDFELTALGVDFVESNAAKIPFLYRMLTGAESSARPANGNGQRALPDSSGLVPSRSPVVATDSSD